MRAPRAGSGWSAATWIAVILAIAVHVAFVLFLIFNVNWRNPKPEAVVAGVARALKPGGVFAVQDYINWAALSLSPQNEAFVRVMPAVGKSWRMHGGDPQVGQRLPGMMAAAGLVVEEIRPLQRIARPGDPLWDWPATFFANFIPMLVERGLVSADDWQAFQHEWAECTRDPNAVFWTPSMVEIIARRPA